MSRRFLVLTFCLLFLFVVASQGTEIIPAGTILKCTMDEPNLSSRTVTVGDPVLCHLGPLGSFGHSVFPRGALLGGHFQDYKNPGHFFGKGWMAVEFDRLILPGAQVLPLSAKVISAPHLKVDAQGDMHSKGHPKRDAVLWAIPVLWPIKVLSLPARGPFPALRGESRLGLRLMEDVEVPFPVAKSAVPTPPWVGSNYRSPSPTAYHPAATTLQEAQVRRITYSPQATTAYSPQHTTPDAPLTIIALQAGAALLARQYWVEGDQLKWVANDGSEQVVPLSAIDLAQTVMVNQERNVEFALRSKPVLEQ